MAAGKTGPVLPWMRVPITIQPGTGVPIDDVQGLDRRLADELETGSRFHELFPVQAAVWQHSGGGLSTAHDLCVAAPTGSGKTLAYALPVINALSALQGGAGTGRLRALVVLPTRDLAAQVCDVFRPLCAAVGLRVVLAAARASEAAEAAQLVGAAAAAAGGGGGGRVGGGGSGSGARATGADVVVATPGRLMAHLSGTPGFTLRHLRFLVIDETDRLLRQSYQDWLPGVMSRLEPSRPRTLLQPDPDLLLRVPGDTGVEGDTANVAACWPAATPGTALPFSQPRTVKIVVSATLTRDPAKLQRLALHNPRYVATTADGGGGARGAATAAAGAAAPAGGAAAGRYSLPRSLSEFRVLCSAARKPLVLLALLSEAVAEGRSCIVFTSSLEMTHKLFLMLRAVPELADQVVEYSSLVAARERVAGLERFRSGAVRVLVASDAMTRGMDIDIVQDVINYDAPVYAKTYVHRAGRTARAGKAGRVFTLLRDEDMRHFKAMIRKADNNFVRDFKPPPEQVDGFKPALAGALRQVEELLAEERLADQRNEAQRQVVQAKPRAQATGAEGRVKSPAEAARAKPRPQEGQEVEAKVQPEMQGEAKRKRKTDEQRPQAEEVAEARPQAEADTGGEVRRKGRKKERAGMGLKGDGPGEGEVRGGCKRGGRGGHTGEGAEDEAGEGLAEAGASSPNKRRKREGKGDVGRPPAPECGGGGGISDGHGRPAAEVENGKRRKKRGGCT